MVFYINLDVVIFVYFTSVFEKYVIILLNLIIEIWQDLKIYLFQEIQPF